VALAAALIERGYDPGFDVNLLPGQTFGVVIDDMIDRAKAVITIGSPPALTSTWVRAEAARARIQKKLVSVRTVDVHPDTLPTPYNVIYTPLYTEIDAIVSALVALGVRPQNTPEADLPPIIISAALDGVRSAPRRPRGKAARSECTAVWRSL
jgi:hypothetical protein